MSKGTQEDMLMLIVIAFVVCFVAYSIWINAGGWFERILAALGGVG